MVLAATGVDRWHEVCAVPQQLEGARYPAMAAFFERVGPCHLVRGTVEQLAGSVVLASDHWAVTRIT
jgi:hypothetical protein